jgi:hypothetical protein
LSVGPVILNDVFDWGGFEAALLEALVANARGPDHAAAALDELYSETDGIICAPTLFLNTDGKRMDSPPDWDGFVLDWAPAHWLEALTTEACAAATEHWDNTFARYEELLIRVCVAAGARLEMPVFFTDQLVRCLTPAQLSSMFPEIIAAQEERAWVATLPTAEQIAYYLSRLDRFDTLITSDEAQDALRDFGCGPCLPCCKAMDGRGSPPRPWPK